jgi:hypothetical protein
VIFEKGAPRGTGRNNGPPHGMQFFGMVEIGGDGVMNVSLKDINDNLLWSRKLDPVKG